MKVRLDTNNPIDNVYKGPHFHRWFIKARGILRPCLAVTWGSRSMGSSWILALSSSPSRPVGFSGTKNRWGLNQEASLTAFPESSADVGVQSISSSWDTLFTGVEPCKDGTPNTGLTCVTIGFDDKESDASTSCSGKSVVGVLEREPKLGVAEREESSLWVWLSTRRIAGGRSVRWTKKELTIVLTKSWLSNHGDERGYNSRQVQWTDL